MSPYYRVAAMILRLVAAGMILIGGLNAGLEIVSGLAGKGDASVWRGALHGALGLAGLVLLLRSSTIARRLTEDSDE